jgi:hypothetical protein
MSLPSKLTSYVTSGRPILAAVQSGGITATYVTDHEIAEVVDPGDPSALVAGVAALRGDPALADCLIAQAGTHARELDVSIARHRYAAFIHELAGSTSRW